MSSATKIGSYSNVIETLERVVATILWELDRKMSYIP